MQPFPSSGLSSELPSGIRRFDSLTSAALLNAAVRQWDRHSSGQFQGSVFMLPNPASVGHPRAGRCGLQILSLRGRFLPCLISPLSSVLRFAAGPAQAFSMHALAPGSKQQPNPGCRMPEACRPAPLTVLPCAIPPPPGTHKSFARQYAPTACIKNKTDMLPVLKACLFLSTVTLRRYGSAHPYSGRKRRAGMSPSAYPKSLDEKRILPERYTMAARATPRATYAKM